LRNSRRAGKPAGRKPEKQGLTGLFTKGKNIPTTAQQTLPYREMYRDGVCRVADRYYTKTIEYEDINYQLAQSEDQAAIFDGWSACLNYFDSSLPFQLSFLNHRSRPGSRYSVNIPMQDDDYNSVRCEYVEMLENQIAKSNNGIVRTKLLTFGVNVDDLPTARARLERVEADICGNFKKLGVKCRSLSGLERLELLHGQLHPGSGSPFRFSWDMIPKTGLSTKDFIAPDSFDFRFSRLFRVGTTWGAASYLQILASELSDKLLAELLEMDAEMTITLHIQTVDQAAAVKSIKAKVSDIDKMKVEEQKKAARSGYDMDILPPDLVTYSNDAKTLLEDLQSRNERMFLLTFLVVNMAPTRRELDNDLFTVSGIYNGGEDTGPSYEIPGEALDDPAFAALMEEATKYIGWPYVWGGSSPSTSFDCSGFVCWVYTASGVHNLPRTTAQGIYNQCAIISPSEAKPGDIIFFTGTYDSPGPVSHVGIYVGDGMMLHCGSPIQYANINSSYWQTHFYAFGRL